MAGASSTGANSHGNTSQNASATNSSSTSTTVEALAMGLKNTEVISILKRRNNSSENVNDNLKYTSSMLSTGGNSPSIHSQTYSDSSLQKYDDDDDDDESDSDWDGFQVREPLFFSFLNPILILRFSNNRIANVAVVDLICPIWPALFSEKFPTFCGASKIIWLFGIFFHTFDVKAKYSFNFRVTAGRENVLYHYVEIEVGEGMLLAPPSMNSVHVISFAFQKAALLIHNILQNTIRYLKSLLSLA